MNSFIPWNSQPLEEWSRKHAGGQFIDLDGKRTHYIQRGSGEPVILIHGFNLDGNTWINNIDALANHFRVLVPDLWGAGFSSRESLEYGFDLYSSQIQLFMDRLDIPRASLIGHSMGGGTAINFAVANPSRVEKLVLVDSVGIPADLPFRARIFRLPGVAELLMSIPTDRIRRKNLNDIWFHDPSILSDDLYRTLTSFQKIKGTTEALLAILRKDFFNTLRSEIAALGKLDIPTLIVWGREDSSVPLSSGYEIHNLLKHSRFEILDEAGHMPNFERPETFNGLVIDFHRTDPV